MTMRNNRHPLTLLILLVTLSLPAMALTPPQDQPSPFLLKETSVRTWITGPVAGVEVTQRWENPNPFPVDGLYIFPLPEDAAVTDMTLQIGERVVRSEMKPREEARRIYEQARREGKVAGLLDQERPNVFAQQVANLMPGMSIEVVLQFDQPIPCEDGICEYVFPTVVGPRFVPASQGDPGRIAPPVVPEGSRTGQRLSLQLSLDAGVSYRDLRSPSHRLEIVRQDEARASVLLVEGEGSRLDRDFRLRWDVGGELPEIGVMAWRDAEAPEEPGTFTLLLQPPAHPRDEDAAPRELIFVLDCSGSMSGAPIEAAKNVVRGALAGARPVDTVQIIRFSERSSGMSAAPLPATPANLARARRYIDSLQGQGGTHMIEGIRAALDRPADPDRLRIVAFLTDGYIGNERQILAEVQRLVGDARMFSFGIGSSVNRYLLEGLAEEGRGAAAFLGPREKPGEMVDRFLRRIETPVLTDIRISFEDLEVEDLEPGLIPDLFAGQTVLVHGRYTRPGTGVIVIEGKRGGRAEVYREVVTFLEQERDHEALGRLWARARIHRLQRQLHTDPGEQVQGSIVELALRHRLMTPWTSLVAVDSEISNRTGGSTSVSVPVEMPEDVSYEGVFGNGRAMLMMKHAYAAPAPVRSVEWRRDASRPRSLGYVASSSDVVAEPQALSAHRVVAQKNESSKLSSVDAVSSGGLADAEERVERENDHAAAATPFLRVTLHRADGTQITLQQDGEVWRVDGSRRTLVGRLGAKELAEVARLLTASHATSWGGPASGPRLQVVGPWGSGSLSLPASDPGVSRLVARLEELAVVS